MDKRFIVILTVIILILGGLFIFTRNKASAPGSETVSSVSNHVRGNPDSGVSLLVYGDFECSVCGPFYFIEKEVFETRQDKMSITFRHFPLDGIHPNARAGSRAAEAAGMQGKFFDMHDTLYENQDSWVGLSTPLSAFEKYASSMGLDVEKFKADYASEVVNSIINADYKEGQSKNVDGTPTYFLNGEKLDNGEISTVEKFAAKIDAAIAENAKTQ